MRAKIMASKVISVLLVAVMIVTSVSVSFAETDQNSDITTQAAQDVDNTSGADDSNASAIIDEPQVSDTDTADDDVSSDEGGAGEAGSPSDENAAGAIQEESGNVSEEETAEEGITLFAEQGYTITFDKNGGNGSAPAPITADEDGNFTFPDKGSMTRSGYTFMGWGKAKNTGHCDTSDGSIPKNTTYYSIYEPGEKGSVRRNTTYYAVWARSESASYFIRLDGTVPREPGDYSTSIIHAN